MQLKIKGTGSKGSCSPTIELPGAYKADDADIYIPNYYNGYVATNYKAPGGPLATCGGAGGAAPVAPPASNSTAAPATSVAAAETETPVLPTLAPTVPSDNATVPSAPAAPTTFATLPSPSAGITAPAGAVPTGSAGTAKLYYQCGGINYTGPTECEGTAKCVKQNDFYSQCIN
jgi:cellulase